MSYVRFGQDGSEVYLIATTSYPGPEHVIECCGCRFIPVDDEGMYTKAFPHFRETAAALAHLRAHREAGHVVPDSAFARIEHDDWLESEEAERAVRAQLGENDE